MNSRFSAMISIMNATIKTGTQFCEVPSNSLCIATLRLLRDQGYIWGFTFASPSNRERRYSLESRLF